MEQNKETINWEQRRYEIAKEILSAIYTTERAEEVQYRMTSKTAAGEAVRYADALITLLKQKGGQP